MGTILLPSPLANGYKHIHQCNWKQNLIISYYYFYSPQKFTHSDTSHHTRKNLAIKAFHYPFLSKVSRLLPANHLPQHSLSGSYSCQILVTKIFLSEILFVRTYPLWAFVCGNISIIISTMMAGRSFCYSLLFPPRGYASLSFHLTLPSL